MASGYPFKDIEPKWQAQWEKDGVYHAKDLPASEKDKKFYGLIEFPYPSGEGLHVGHPRSYTAIDIMTRKKRMEGKNVLYPIGWDAFGLPTENFAIKHKMKPQEATSQNVANFTRQIKSLGIGFDWSREINTTDPKYYKWTQWMFLKFFNSYFDDVEGRALPIDELAIPDHVSAKGEAAVRAYVDSQRMAYKAETKINWCPKDKIGLAKEEAIGGVCERCGTAVEERMKKQWMIRITKYANRLIEDLATVDYLDKIKAQQINWIGKSEGAEITFPLYGIPGQEDGKHLVTIFTTRPDTLFGATFLVMSPEKAKMWIDVGWQATEAVKDYVTTTLRRTEVERMTEGKEKTGIDAGITAKNPANGELIPVWIADYVLGGYGTGAIMAVPAHDERDFEFSKRFNLPIKCVVVAEKTDYWKFNIFEERIELQKWLYDANLHNPDSAKEWQAKIDDGYLNYKEKCKNNEIDHCFAFEGVAIGSGLLDDLSSNDAKEKMIEWLESNGVGQRKTTYKLRDWVFSRQRYWGEPIPIIDCATCGYVPVPDASLPVTLPDVEAYEPTDTGESPLANISSWVDVACPKCGGAVHRETDTMPNWAGSSWYFLRYCDPQNDQAFASPEKLKFWMPVDLYNGGMEHTTLHLLYSRFWYKFLFDLDLIPQECGSEPYAKRRSHALILGEGGIKMSKSKGNVVNPDDIVSEYGADVFRTYEMFIGPFDADAPWDTNGIEGVKRFLDKVWRMLDGVVLSETKDLEEKTETLFHQTIKKVTEDIEGMHFNTAVSSLMILVNALSDTKEISRDVAESTLKLLAPFAPHLAEELWHKIGNTSSIHVSGWPMFNPFKIVASTFEMVVQVNGKVRDRIAVNADIAEDEAKKLALESEKVKALLDGKEPEKVMYIKGRLVNIVIAST